MSAEWQHRLEEIAAEVAALRRRVAAGGKVLNRTWRRRIARRSFAPSALNLAHYLVFRQIDLRLLQRRLMALGLSSLGRAESRVLATLDAVGAALGLMTDRAEMPAMPSERQFFRGEKSLAENAAVLFGPPSEGRAGRIMVTLGTEAADDPALVLDYARRGANLVRINCAHDDQDAWARMIENTRQASRETGRIRILMDIAGPKVRTGTVYSAAGHERVAVGDEILLTDAIDPGRGEFPFQCTCTIPGVFGRVRVGNRLSYDDGVLRGVVAREVAGGLVVRVDDGRLKGVKLKAEKGLIFPTVDLGLSPLSEEDLRDLDFISDHADLIGYSFVETAEQVALVQAELARRRLDWQEIGLVAKIETPRAVRNLPEIIVQAAGQQPLAVMIARGDLAIELGFERLAEMQEEILWICEAAHVPAIWATQVLEGLVKAGLPSRGEMTDAAMAGRAECVMLNKGPNVGVAIDALDRLLHRMGGHQIKKTPTLRALKSWADVSGSHTDFAPPEDQAEWRAGEAEIVAQAVDDVAAVGVGQLFRPRAEGDEGRRARLQLGQVAQLDAAACDRRRRMALDRVGEPAVEPGSGDALVPRGVGLADGGEQGIGPLPGQARHRHQRDAGQLGQEAGRLLGKVGAPRLAIGDEIPPGEGDDDGAALLLDEVGDLEVLLLEGLAGIDGEDHHLGEANGAQRIADGELLQLRLDARLATKAGGIEQAERLAAPGPVDGDGVTGDAGFRAGQQPLLAEDTVDQRRLADVRPADDSDAERWASALPFGFGRLRQVGRQRLQKVAHALAVLGRDGNGIAEAKGVGLEQAGVGGGPFGLVGGEHQRDTGGAQEVGEAAVERRQPDAGVHQEQDGIGGLHRRLGLRGHAGGEAAGGRLVKAGGVDGDKAQVAEAGLALAAVAGDTRRVIDQRHAMADKAVEQRRLADVRPTDNRDAWQTVVSRHRRCSGSPGGRSAQTSPGAQPSGLAGAGDGDWAAAIRASIS